MSGMFARDSSRKSVSAKPLCRAHTETLLCAVLSNPQQVASSVSLSHPPVFLHIPQTGGKRRLRKAEIGSTKLLLVIITVELGYRIGVFADSGVVADQIVRKSTTENNPRRSTNKCHRSHSTASPGWFELTDLKSTSSRKYYGTSDFARIDLFRIQYVREYPRTVILGSPSTKYVDY